MKQSDSTYGVNLTVKKVHVFYSGDIRYPFLCDVLATRSLVLAYLHITKKPVLRQAFLMAGVTRLELATSCVTGRRSNQLSYTPTVITWYLIHNKKNNCKYFFLNYCFFITLFYFFLSFLSLSFCFFKNYAIIILL